MREIENEFERERGQERERWRERDRETENFMRNCSKNGLVWGVGRPRGEKGVREHDYPVLLMAPLLLLRCFRACARRKGCYRVAIQ